ncbi:MAG: M48 family metalloprotease [Candidatus Brockarchaeota archaeon]|nr:M48 family metalloprotease [Candidatus Brockarchaeota archaeon]
MPSIYKLKTAMLCSVALTLAFFAAFAFGLGLIASYYVQEFGLIELLAISLAFSSAFVLLEYVIGPSVVRASLGGKLRYLGKGENPWLEETVADLCARSGLKKPRLAVVEDRSPNAFVFGRTQSDSTLAVHEGLLANFREDEVRAVIGHELGHLAHKDCAVVTMLAAIPTLAYVVARVSFESLRVKGKKGSWVALPIAAGALSIAIYAITQLLVLGLSRLREHYADAFSAYLTGTPRSLISALAKLSYGISVAPRQDSPVSTFYILNPAAARDEVREIVENKEKYDLDRDGLLDERELELAMEQEGKSFFNRATELYSTHPPTFKRILMLKQIEEEILSSPPPG